MAAPAFGSIGTYAGPGSPTAAMSFEVPSGIAVDDIIVIPIFIDGTFTITSYATGFAEAPDSPISGGGGGSPGHSLHVVWKRVTGPDAGTYDFGLSGPWFYAGAAARYTGCVNTGSPWDVTTSTFDDTSLTSPPAVSVTTSGDDRLLVYAASDWGGGSWTPPSGFTERMDAGTGVHTLDDKLQSVAGSSGSVQATCTGSSRTRAWLGALQAGAGVTSPRPPIVVRPSLAATQRASW